MNQQQAMSKARAVRIWAGRTKNPINVYLVGGCLRLLERGKQGAKDEQMCRAGVHVGTYDYRADLRSIADDVQAAFRLESIECV